MSLKYSFFDAVVQDGVADRTYSADDFANYFSSFVGNGVFEQPSTAFKVNAGGNYNITVSAGKAFIQGRFIENTETYTISSITPSQAQQYFEVVLRLDKVNREVSIYLRSIYSSTPVVVRTANVYDLCLAVISIPANSTAITAGMITDYRWNTTYCGKVSSLITQIDTSDLYNSFMETTEETLDDFEVEFTAWFNQIKGQVSGDLGVRLTQSVNSLNTSVSTLSANATPKDRALNTWYKESTEAPNFVKLPSGGLSVSTIYEVHLPLNGGNNNSGWVPHITGWQLKPFENGTSTSLTRWNYARCHGVRIKKVESSGELYKFDAVFYLHNDTGSAISIRPAVSVLWTLQRNRPDISDKIFNNTNVQAPVEITTDD